MITSWEKMAELTKKSRPALKKIMENPELSKYMDIELDEMVTISFHQTVIKEAARPAPKKAPVKAEFPATTTIQTLPAKSQNEPVRSNPFNHGGHYLDKEMLEMDEKGIIFSGNLLKCVIGDYLEWMQQRQINSAFLIGKAHPGKLYKPEIKPEDVKFFRLIATAFAKSGMQTKGQVIRCFRKIYAHWEHLSDYNQKGILPRQIYSNLTSIMDQLLVEKQKLTKKDEQERKFDKEIRAGQERDYSGLVRG